MIRKILNRLGIGDSIQKVNTYLSYEAYLNHQKEKTADPLRRKKWLGEEWETKLRYFENTFSQYKKDYFKASHKKAVGLGARTGQEVQAFINLGFEAVGLDIVPCEPLVIEGDIHKMPFPDEEFDIAFTNIYDHSLYPEKFASEIQRILKKDGIAILHLAVGTDTDPFGVIEISNASAILALFSKMKVLRSERMPEWGGGLNWEIILEKQ